MKKNLRSMAIIGCISASVIVSSCSIVKRHYSKGYYVSHSSSKTSNDAQAKSLSKKMEVPSHTAYNIHTKGVENNDGPAQNLIATTEVGNTIVASNENAGNKNMLVATPSKKHIAYSTMAMGYTKENAKSFHAKKATADSLAADALSLFWIIILIILILWLVAILTGGWGLGWAINFLLLIALVLLILWLLRII